jgi:ammonia channel protein AmtB
LDVVEAGQRVVVDRIELIRSDLLRTISEVQHQLFLWVAAVLLLSTAWIAFNCTATMFLAQRLSWVIAGLITAAVNGAIGLALITRTRKRRSDLVGAIGEVK